MKTPTLRAVNQRSPIPSGLLVEEPSIGLTAEPLAAEPLATVDRVELQLSSSAQSSEPASGRAAALKVFFSTFITIFLAELGDKTQVTTLLMTAESHAPWTVFAGAGTALVATSLIGVWLGCWLAKRVSPRTLETAAGGLLLLVSAQLFWEIFQG